MSYFVLGNVYWTFNLQAVSGLFWTFKMFYCDGRDGTGRWSKVSFKFLQTLWIFRTCIYILVYKIKVAANILMGFKIWCQVGGGGQNFQIYGGWVTFLFLGLKVNFLGGWVHKIWVLVGGFNFRLGTYNVPSGSSAPSITPSAKRELWRTGRDGTVIKSVL